MNLQPAEIFRIELWKRGIFILPTIQMLKYVNTWWKVYKRNMNNSWIWVVFGFKTQNLPSYRYTNHLPLSFQLQASNLFLPLSCPINNSWTRSTEFALSWMKLLAVLFMWRNDIFQVTCTRGDSSFWHTHIKSITCRDFDEQIDNFVVSALADRWERRSHPGVGFQFGFPF